MSGQTAPFVADQFVNFGSSTIAGGAGGIATALNPTDTSLILQSGDGARMPATGPSMFLLGTPQGPYELVQMTARTTDTMTIVRAQEGTTAGTWAVNSPVTQVTTAGNLAGLWNALLPAPFNVRSYGAMGDGSTDDTTAIQNAITAAATIKLANPASAPAATGNTGTGSGFTAGNNVNVAYTFVTAEGETAYSPLRLVTIGTTGNNIVVTLPTFPAGVIGANVYCSATNGSTTIYKATAGYPLSSVTSGGTVTLTAFASSTQPRAPVENSTGGGNVYIPAGIYMVHLTQNPNISTTYAAMHVPSNVSIYGDGPQNTIIRLITNSAVEVQSMITNWNPQASGADTAIRFQDFTLDGNAQNQAGVVNLDHCDGFQMIYCNNLQFINVVSKNHWGTTNGTNGPGGQTGESHQFLVWHCADVSFLGCNAYADPNNGISSCFCASESFNVRMADCTAHDTTYGLAFTTFSLTGLVLVNCVGYNVGDNGFLFELDSYVSVVNCQAGGITPTGYQAGKYASATQLPVHNGFQVTGSSHVVFDGCIAEYGTVCGFNVAQEASPLTQCSDVLFLGCIAGHNTSHGFLVNHATADVTLIGCTAHNNTSVGIYNLSTDTTGRTKIIGCRVTGNASGIRIDSSAIAFTDIISIEATGNTNNFVLNAVNYTKMTGVLTAPTVPATTVALSNPYPTDVTAYIVGGTVTVIAVDGTTIATATSTTLPVAARIPPGKTITLTYSVAPTWVWVGD